MVPASLHCRATSRPEPRSRHRAALVLLQRQVWRVGCLLPVVCRLPPAAYHLLPATCCLPPVACRPPPVACHLLPTALADRICHLLPVACRLLPAAFRLPTAVYRLLPVACRLLPAALTDRICHLLPAACCLGRPPSAAPAERRTSPPATTPTLPPIRPIDATIGIAPAPLSDMPPQFRMQFPEDSHPRRPTNRRISTI